MGFYSNVKKTLDNDFNMSRTENGAVGYRTSGKELLDINFAVASMRRTDEKQIVTMFNKAYFEDPKYAMLWLFYLRDVRGGLGERRSFRFIVHNLATESYEKMSKLIPLIAEYGRWDDLLLFIGTPFEKQVVKLIKNQINEDWNNYLNGKPCSLCAKWLPSANTSSAETKRMAKILIPKLGLTERKYRQTLSALRKYINIVEVKMSAKNWKEIEYSAVPSRANLIYNSAFLRNDEERRREFLGNVEKGTEKINASVLYPHDIVNKYISGGWSSSVKALDQTLEALWKALPNTVNGDENTIVVADGSGSMTSGIGSGSVRALDVANALAIYFAEHMQGEFKDKYITFSGHPQLVDFSNAKTLRDKLKIALMHDECANTNIEAVFNLILKTALNNHMDKNEMPRNVLIISDMEFDSAASHPSANLFKQIARKYEDAGYKLPRLVFWNVNSRTGTIPVKENENGVALVSGFSVNIVKMVMSGKTDPYECLIEQLNSERYLPVAEAIS